MRQVKAGGYKAVHMVPKGQLTTVPRYDEMITHQSTLSPNNTRPESSVVRTIGQQLYPNKKTKRVTSRLGLAWMPVSTIGV